MHEITNKPKVLEILVRAFLRQYENHFAPEIPVRTEDFFNDPRVERNVNASFFKSVFDKAEYVEITKHATAHEIVFTFKKTSDA